MHVKKFEARTIKEALEMVKREMGPEAIILNVKDNTQSFGLVGDRSVEITAATRETSLQKKKYVEARVSPEVREKLFHSSARFQKQFIDEMVEKKTTVQAKQRAPRYIDIADDVVTQAPAPTPAKQNLAPTQFQSTPVQQPQTNREVETLKAEIQSLKSMISQFQNIPQRFAPGHPGSEYGVSYEGSFTFAKLTTAGVSEEISADIVLKVQESLTALKMKNKAVVDGYAAKIIMELTRLETQAESARIHQFVGPQGSGKTSQLVKFGSHLVLNQRKRIAIISADSFKIGAAEQLRIFAQILDVPFQQVRNELEMNRALASFGNMDAILIDFPGMSLKTVEEISWIKKMMCKESSKIHLVLSALTKDSDLQEISRRYRLLDYSCLSFTGLDDCSQPGVIFNTMKRENKGLFSFGLGNRLPEDFELATKERCLDLIFKLSKIQQEQNL